MPNSQSLSGLKTDDDNLEENPFKLSSHVIGGFSTSASANRASAKQKHWKIFPKLFTSLGTIFSFFRN